jgi:FKBP-type peptidyl-prolyl cis-trans isomerase FkpA
MTIFSGAIAAVFTLLAAPATLTADVPLQVPLFPIVPAAQQTCDTTLPSGLSFKILRAGEGATPKGSDLVLLRYVGYLRTNGLVFDQNAQAVFALDGVVPGFSEGVAQMNKGAIYRICIPAALGYGAEANDPIPANSDLGFQVELVDFKTAEEIEKLRAAEAAAGQAMAPEVPIQEK